MTGTTWLEDSGFLDGPVMITNTHSVGVVRDAVIAWKVKRGQPDMEGYWWSLPVVAETWDGFLNDINGFHVKPEHVFHALDSAHAGAVEEGSVGGGTGMICNEFKGGIGTSSRVLDAKRTAATRSACSCSAITDAATNFALPAFPWARKSPSIQRTEKTPARSSLSSPPTRRSFRLNSSASHAVHRSAWAAMAATPATARAIFSLPFRPPTRARPVPKAFTI